MSRKFKIVIPEMPIEREQLPQQILEECELIEGDKNVRGDNEQLMKEIRGADAIIFNSCNDITAELMASAPDLKIAFKSGAKPENVDYEYAKTHGIAVGWTPAANAQSVAEYAVLLMLNAQRLFLPAVQVLRDGGWRNQCGLGNDICGLTVGLMGFGGIGRNVARILQGFQAKVIAFDPYTSDEAFAEAKVSRVSFDELLAQSDILSIHCMLTEETRNIFNQDAFSRMKKTAVLVNTARGGMIDEKALVEALQTGEIAGAALDVYEPEPPSVDHPLKKLDNVIMTPHIAARTNGAAYRECAWAIQGALDYLNKREIRNATVLVPDLQ